MNASQSLGSRIRFIVILGALIAFAPLSIDMYLPAFPAIADYFGVAPGAVQTTLAVFFVGLAVGQGILGPVMDSLGRLRPLLLGIAVFVAASVWASFASDIASLSAARLLQALGGCAGIVASRAMVRDLFDERASAQVYSLLMLVMGLAPILAPVIGGFLIANFEWQVIFWVLAAFGALCIPAVFFGLGETLPPEKRHRGLSLAGVGRAYLALCMDGPFLAFALANALLSSAMFAYITGSPFVFIELHGLAPEAYAILFGVNAAGLIAASQVNALLLRRISGRAILKAAMTFHLAAALALLGFTLFMPQAFLPLAACIFLVVSSYGFVGANATAAAMARADGNAGSASALTGILQFALAAVMGGLVGAFNDGSALPMALVILAASLSGTLVRLAARRA